jgi:hypothetical protein
MTFTSWVNELDSHRDDPDLAGAIEMVVTAANEVAVASRDSRRIVSVRQDLTGNRISIRKSDVLSHRPTALSYHAGRLYCACRRTFNQSGKIFIFNNSNITRPLYEIDDEYVVGPILTQPALSVYVFSRSDRPSFVARRKSDNVEVTEIHTQFKITKVWGDLVDQGLFYCANAVNTTLERIRWNESAQKFTIEDPITLPHSEGLLSLVVRDGQVLYTTHEHVVHFDIETEEIKFSYHDFWAGFGDLDQVAGVDFGVLDDPQQLEPDVTYEQRKVVSTQVYGVLTRRNAGITGVPSVTFSSQRPAGVYRISYSNEALAQMSSLDGGVTWGCPGSTGLIPGWQFTSCTGDPAFNVETGGTGHVGDGMYDTPEHAMDAYEGSFIDVHHEGGAFTVGVWDTDFTDNASNIATSPHQVFRVEVLSLDVPYVPPVQPGGIPIEGTSLIVYQHPNLDDSEGMTQEYLDSLKNDRLKNNLSHQYRNKFRPPEKGLFEGFGEMYGSKEYPYEIQFRDIGPKLVVRTVNSAYIYLDPLRGRVGFTGSLIFEFACNDYSTDQISDVHHGHQVVWDSFLETPPAVLTRTVRSRDGYPNIPTIWTPGIEQLAYGQGQNWNAKFFAGDVTVMAWVRPENNPERPTNDYQRLISTKHTWDDETGTFGMSFRMDDQAAYLAQGRRFEMFGSGGWPPPERVLSLEGLPELSDGEWHFYVGIIGAYQSKVYVDLRNVTLVGSPALVKPSDIRMTIGKIAGMVPDTNDPTTGHQPDFYRGGIGMIRVYNESVTIDHMMAVYERTKAYFGH